MGDVQKDLDDFYRRDAVRKDLDDFYRRDAEEPSGGEEGLGFYADQTSQFGHEPAEAPMEEFYKPSWMPEGLKEQESAIREGRVVIPEWEKTPLDPERGTDWGAASREKMWGEGIPNYYFNPETMQEERLEPQGPPLSRAQMADAGVLLDQPEFGVNPLLRAAGRRPGSAQGESPEAYEARLERREEVLGPSTFQKDVKEAGESLVGEAQHLSQTVLEDWLDIEPLPEEDRWMSYGGEPTFTEHFRAMRQGYVAPTLTGSWRLTPGGEHAFDITVPHFTESAKGKKGWDSFLRNTKHQLLGIAALPEVAKAAFGALMDPSMPIGKKVDVLGGLILGMPESIAESWYTLGAYGPGAVAEQGIMSMLDVGYLTSALTKGVAKTKQAAHGSAARRLMDPELRRAIDREGLSPSGVTELLPLEYRPTVKVRQPKKELAYAKFGREELVADISDLEKMGADIFANVQADIAKLRKEIKPDPEQLDMFRQAKTRKAGQERTGGPEDQWPGAHTASSADPAIKVPPASEGASATRPYAHEQAGSTAQKALKEQLTAKIAERTQIAAELKKVRASIHTEGVVKWNPNPRIRRLELAYRAAETTEGLLKKLSDNPYIWPIYLGKMGFNKGLDVWAKKGLSRLDKKGGPKSLFEASLEKPSLGMMMKGMAQAKDRPGLARWSRGQVQAEGEAAIWWKNQEGRIREAPKEDLLTMWETLHFDALATDHALRSAGVQRRGNTFHYGGSDPKVSAKVETMNSYGWLVDMSHNLTRMAIDEGLIVLSRKAQAKYLAGDLEGALLEAGLDAVWAPRMYKDLERHAWTRAEKKGNYRLNELREEVASLLPGSDLGRQRIAKRRREREASDRGIGTGQTAGILGESLRVRELRALEAEKGFDVLERDYGLQMDIRSTVLDGMLSLRQDIGIAKMWRELAQDASQVSLVPKQGWMHMKNKVMHEHHGTAVREYPGMPDEFYVNPDIGAELVSIRKLQQYQSGPLTHYLRKALQWWKRGKTVYSTGSHATNIFGNALVLAPAAGINPLNPANAKYYAAAARAMGMEGKVGAEVVVMRGRPGPVKRLREWEGRPTGPSPHAKTRVDLLGAGKRHRQQRFGKEPESFNQGAYDPMATRSAAGSQILEGSPRRTLEGEDLWTLAVRHGVQGPRRGMTRAELDANVKMAEHYGGVLGTKQALKSTFQVDFLGAVTKRAWPEAYGAVKTMGAELLDLPKAMYQAEDTFYRMALFAKLIDKGMDPAQAAQKARKAFGDYENLSAFGTMMSQSLLGVPFLAFNARVVPQFVAWMAREPMKAKNMMMVHQAVSDLHLRAMGSSLGEYRAKREDLPPWLRERMIPSLLAGDMEVDYTKYIPGWEYLPIEGEKAQDTFKRAYMGQNPFMNLTMAHFTGVDPHFGRKLHRDKESPEGKKAYWDHFSRTLAPSRTYGLGVGYGDLRIKAAEEGRPRPGRDFPESPFQASLASNWGIRTQTMPTEGEMETHRERGGLRQKGAWNNIRREWRSYVMGRGKTTHPDRLAEQFQYYIDQIEKETGQPWSGESAREMADQAHTQRMEYRQQRTERSRR